MLSRLKIAFLLIATTLCMSVSAQNEILRFKGNIKDEANLKKLEGAQLIVFQNGAQFDVFEAGASGKFDFSLPLGFTYDIKCTRSGYAMKIVRIDTRNIPSDDRAGGFQVDADFALFVMPEGFNEDIMKDPIGIASFDSQQEAMAFDFDYTENMQDKIKSEMDRIEKLNKDKEKFQKEFEKLMAEGGQKMIETKYEDAMLKFDGAKKIFPKDENAIKKYDEAKAAYDAQQLAKANDAKYVKLIADADAAFNAKKWDVARKGYNDAIALKKEEKYPKEQLYQIDQRIKEEEKYAEYDKIIAEADAKFNNKDYAVAIDKYKEAIAKIGTEPYPKEQIKKAQTELDGMLAAEAKRKQDQKRYDDLMALGEKNIKDKKYDDALASFKDADNVFADDTQPGVKIKEVEGLIASMRKEKENTEAVASAEAERLRIEKLYNDKIIAADKLFTESKQTDLNKLEAAKKAYNEALEIKKGEKYPNAQISVIDSAIASINKGKSDAELAAREAEKAEAERLRIEGEYKKHLEAADKLFAESKQKDEAKLTSARAEYQAASDLKKTEKYPPAQISLIDNALAQLAKDKSESELAAQRLKDEQAKKAEADRLAREEAARLAEEKRQERLAEEERLRKEREALAEKNKTEKPTNNGPYKTVDRSREDEVDRYYREARAIEYAAKDNKVQRIKEEELALADARSKTADRLIGENQDNINSQKDNMEKMSRNGEAWIERSTEELVKKKEEDEANKSEYEQRADNRIDNNTTQAEKQKESQAALVENDANRQKLVEEQNIKEEQYAENEKAFESRGNTGRSVNMAAVEREKQAQIDAVYNGEKVRQDNVTVYKAQKETAAGKDLDTRKAAEVRLGSEYSKQQEIKSKSDSFGEDKENSDNIAEMERLKEEKIAFEVNQQAIAEEKAVGVREELFSKDAGAPRSEMEGTPPPGTEQLPQGVTETSRELGNKKIIERIVKRGNKVDTYKKIVSKTGIYYFKNNQPITEQMWIAETLPQE